jgi:hypothetical protein
MPTGPKLCKAAGLALIAILACGCVKKEDYERVMKEKAEVQAQLDQRQLQIRQLQEQLAATQIQLTQIVELQTRLKDALARLEERQKEIDELNARWEKYKEERRQGMIGREYPELRLDDGRLLKKVRLTAMQGSEVSFMHEGGVVKVLLSKSNDQLRWQACFDPTEAADSERAAMLAKARLLDQRLYEKNTSSSGPAISTSQSTSGKTEEIRVLESVIRAQRKALNDAHARLSQQQPAALRGAHWNSARPEDSGLLNVFAERRIVLGISQLDSMATAIKANLRRLQDLRGP